jgi:hypothetical protein
MPAVSFVTLHSFKVGLKITVSIDQGHSDNESLVLVFKDFVGSK